MLLVRIYFNIQVLVLLENMLVFLVNLNWDQFQELILIITDLHALLKFKLKSIIPEHDSSNASSLITTGAKAEGF